jgi:hypothetical protein
MDRACRGAILYSRSVPAHIGYTKSMKTAISIPDDVFAGAERLARHSKKSRSQLYSEAIRDYVARHASDEITEAMDRVCAQFPASPDAFVSAASARVLKRTEW